MKFNLGELESLFCDIQDIIDYIEVSNFEGRKFSMFLSNGDKIDYKLFNDHVPHLLGININALESTGLFKKQSSFDTLKEMVSNPYRIHKLYQEGVIDYKNVFSEFINEKIKVFKSNISPNIYEMEFICKYDSKRAYTLTEKTAKYDYLLVKKLRDTESYAVLCLVNNGYYYGAMSSLYFNDKEHMEEYLKEYVENQEISLFNGVRTVGNNGEYERKYNLKPENIVFKLEELLEYKDTFNAIIDTTPSYIYSLKETLKHMDKHYDNNTLLFELVNGINKGKLINRDNYIDSNLIELVDAFNDYLCSYSSNTTISESYTEIQKERNNLKDELVRIKTELEMVMIDRDKYFDECKQLKNENEKYKSNEESIIKILRPNV